MTAHKFKLSRILPATPDDVFEMWLDAESLKTWMCPGDTRVSYIEANARVDGRFRIDMQTRDGAVIVHTGEYLTIQRPHLLVFTWTSSATGGKPSQVTVQLFSHDEGCRLELAQERLPDATAIEKHRAGWGDILDHLAAQVHRKIAE